METLKIPLVKKYRSLIYLKFTLLIGLVTIALALTFLIIMFIVFPDKMKFDTGFPGDWYIFILIGLGIYFVLNYFKALKNDQYYLKISRNEIEFFTDKDDKVQKIQLKDLENISSDKTLIEFKLTNGEKFLIDFRRAGSKAILDLRDKLKEFTQDM